MNLKLNWNSFLSPTICKSTKKAFIKIVSEYSNQKPFNFNKRTLALKRMLRRVTIRINVKIKFSFKYHDMYFLNTIK